MKDKNNRDHVLVIDDDADFRELVMMIGQLCGVPVLSAGDCREGLEVLGRERTNIKMILLDYLMPGMEPATCAHTLVAKAGPQVAIVLVTAAVDPGIRAAELDIQRWIAKPVDVSVLTSLFTEDRSIQL
jgi:CheY-like chemotaxis protein